MLRLGLRSFTFLEFGRLQTLHSSNCVKVLAPSTAEFSNCEPVFVTYRVANQLKRRGMATAINKKQPLVLRLRPRAVSYLVFTSWAAKSDGVYSTSGGTMKFQRLAKGGR